MYPSLHRSHTLETYDHHYALSYSALSTTPCPLISSHSIYSPRSHQLLNITLLRHELVVLKQELATTRHEMARQILPIFRVRFIPIVHHVD